MPFDPVSAIALQEPTQNLESTAMAGRRCEVTDIRELLHRLQAGDSDRQIARGLDLSRNTVANRHWARDQGLLTGPLPEAAALAARLQATAGPPPPHAQSGVTLIRDQVPAWHQQGVEGQAIYQPLVEQHGFPGSYSAVNRFLRRLDPPAPRATLRLEVAPGEEAQVDFGSAGLLVDPDLGRLRRAWAFVMTLSYSRHQYVEFVFDQTITTWCRCHRGALEFFGGAPRLLVIDNPKAGIVRAALYDLEVQRVYRACAEHYGFLIAPCRPPHGIATVETG
jgi:hypothetical protein